MSYNAMDSETVCFTSDLEHREGAAVANPVLPRADSSDLCDITINSSRLSLVILAHLGLFSFEKSLRDYSPG